MPCRRGGVLLLLQDIQEGGEQEERRGGGPGAEVRAGLRQAARLQGKFCRRARGGAPAGAAQVQLAATRASAESPEAKREPLDCRRGGAPLGGVSPEG